MGYYIKLSELLDKAKGLEVNDYCNAETPEDVNEVIRNVIENGQGKVTVETWGMEREEMQQEFLNLLEVSPRVKFYNTEYVFMYTDMMVELNPFRGEIRLTSGYPTLVVIDLTTEELEFRSLAMGHPPTVDVKISI